ncbi:MAG: SsrA-binding protein SmpB [Bacteroidales bacterium]
MKQQTKINIKNKKAFFEYEILDKYVAGLQLYGTEIKSIRDNKASLVEAYCLFLSGELYIRGMYVGEYKFGTCNNHLPRRDRKLLLTKKEIDKLAKKIKEGGLTIVPLKLFLNGRGLAKLEIALAKGKKIHDKRESLKTKDAKRDMDRMKKF